MNKLIGLKKKINQNNLQNQNKLFFDIGSNIGEWAKKELF